MLNIKYKFARQNEYDKLPIKNNNVMYIITDTKRIYIGNDLFTGANDSSSAPDIDLTGYVTKDELTSQLNGYATIENLQEAIESIESTEEGQFIPIIEGNPINVNQDKIPLITDLGSLKASNFTIQELMDYFVSDLNLLTKNDVNVLTEAQYQSLESLNPTTVYIITDTHKIIMGSEFYSSGTTEINSSNLIPTINNSETNAGSLNPTIATPTVVTASKQT